jgi:hypothetical protein
MMVRETPRFPRACFLASLKNVATHTTHIGAIIGTHCHFSQLNIYAASQGLLKRDIRCEFPRFNYSHLGHLIKADVVAINSAGHFLHLQDFKESSIAITEIKSTIGGICREHSS